MHISRTELHEVKVISKIVTKLLKPDKNTFIEISIIIYT